MVNEYDNQEEKEQQIEDDLVEGEDEETTPFKYSISSYGADYPVDGLIKRLDNKDIFIPPFQRGYVWKQKQGSRFIESLLLGLPVPGVFLSREHDTNKLLVIDGQQRLRTLAYFYCGIFADSKKEFVLKGVQDIFEGLSYKNLPEDSRRKLDDSIIHATVLRQEEPSDDDSSIYYVFERLNTGGTFLQPQEIRSCIYHGEFKDALNEMHKNQSWRKIYGPKNNRMRGQELILRFLALYFENPSYKKPMKGFLNGFMGRNKNLEASKKADFEKIFYSTIELIHKSIGEKAFKPKKGINAAVFDSVMVGVAKRLSKGKIEEPENLKFFYTQLLKDDQFLKSTNTGTANIESVEYRVKAAIEIFGQLK